MSEDPKPRPIVVAIAAMAGVYSIWCSSRVVTVDRSLTDTARYAGQAFVTAFLVVGLYFSEFLGVRRSLAVVLSGVAVAVIVTATLALFWRG